MSDPIPTEREGLERDIERTRAELADTVDALAAKADVKGRAKEKAVELKDTARHKVDDLSVHVRQASATASDKAHQVADDPRARTIGPAAGLGLAALVALLVWAIRRRRS